MRRLSRTSPRKPVVSCGSRRDENRRDQFRRRCKRSGTIQGNKESWIASSLTLLAMRIQPIPRFPTAALAMQGRPPALCPRHVASTVYPAWRPAPCPQSCRTASEARHLLRVSPNSTRRRPCPIMSRARRHPRKTADRAARPEFSAMAARRAAPPTSLPSHRAHRSIV